MAINLPYGVFGKVFDTNGTTGIGAGVTVRLRNNTTNEIISTTTDSNNDYVLDGANFASGYTNADKFTIYVISANLEAEKTIEVSENKHQFSLTLVTISDSSLINYTTVQRVYDELDGIDQDDLTAKRVINVVQRAESEIDEYSGMKFTSTTVSQEIYDYNSVNTNMSPEQLEFIGNDIRRDHWNVMNRDRLWLRNRPIVSITLLQRNTAGETATASYETLDEQSGSGGDYILSEDGKAAGYIDFVGDKPRWGKYAVRITYEQGYATTPKNVERLATLLAVRDIVISKISRSMFDTPHRVSLKGILVDRGNAPTAYLQSINIEIDKLWNTIGREFRLV